MAWYLVASLAKLRDEFNNIAPRRDKASDGSVGDAAHSARVSDHNPDEKGAVHAIDVDIDLKLPGLSMEKVVQFLLARCRSGQETRLKYVIFNRRIWSKSAGWREQAYTGQNPHDHHAHFSGVYTTEAERSVKSWQLEDLVSETAPTLSEIKAAVKAELASFDAATSPKTNVTRDGERATLLQRTDYLANKLPAILLGAIAAVNVDTDLSPEQLDTLADDIVAGLPASLAARLKVSLEARTDA